MIKKYAAAAAVGLLCLAGQASATNATVAQLSAVQGSVIVNQDGSYSKAASSSALRPGARIVADDSSSARISYADGCVVTVAPKAVATVGEQSPCASQGLVNMAQPMDFGDSGYLIPLIIVGAIVIAGIIAVANGSDDAPVSP
jgi:hypothetical protein